MTNNRHRTMLNGASLSSAPRWPWWLVGRSPRQVLIALVGPTILAVVALVTPPTNRPYTSWLHWVFLLFIVYLVGCAVASVVALRRDPNLRNATRQRRPVGRATRHLYAVATLIGVAVVLIALVVALIVQAPIAWLVLSAAAVLTLLCFGQVGRPLLDLQSAASISKNK